ncbi:PAS domain-containing protein [Hymenobacter sp. 15J16-1T3B]|uniref:PAS domain-containing protein n=1 Tax=Hymenobacter sp. 15J16-1T3B TaxID=2886941 RepID=UPI001D1158A7|nr:PAS domain-containing protein [Hymenobacter sp. 15J16-1T3B]MCC3157478.1 PAS domain-containing protein [Hymenobacter sp. 15J16-1T3B]
MSDYLALFRHLPGNYLLLAPDEAITIVDNTEQHAAVALKSRAEVAGRPLFEAFPAADHNEAAVLRASIEHVRHHHEPHTMPLIRYDLERPAALGGGLEERYWQAKHYPIVGDDGQLRYILQQTEDVTERHLAEQRARLAQQDLAESQEQIRFMLEALPLMLWTTRADGTADYQNPGWLRFTGRTLDQAREWGWLDDIHPDDRAHVNQAWQQALATGTDYQVEYRLRRHDGEYRWLLVQAVPRRSADGRISSWVGTGTDIHEQKLSQQWVSEKDRQLQQILQLLPAYVATLQGPEHIYTFVNERSRDLLGPDAELGRPAAQVLPDLQPSGLAQVLDLVYRTQQPHVLNEMPVSAPPAASAEHPRYFDGVFQPLTDEQGQSTGVLVFGVDVTPRVQAQQRAAELQEEVRQQNEQFRLLVESLPLYVYITDAEGRMLYVNPQRRAYTGQDAVRALTHWDEPVHPDDAPRMRELFAEGRLLRRPWSGEYRLRRHDGHYRWVLTHAVPLFDAQGQVQRWYGSSVDIDDQKRLQQRLEQQDEQLQRMLRTLPAIINTMEGPEHRYTYISPQMQALVGQRVQLGLRVVEAQPEIAEQGFVEVLDRVYQSGEPFVALEQRVDLLSPDTGQLETRYFNFSYQLLPEVDNRPASRGILSFALDVTEQVRARQRTEELQAEVNRHAVKLSRMTEALPAISFILTPDMRLEYFSPQWHQLTGFPPGTDADAVWPTLIHPDDRPTAYATYERAIAQNTPLEFEYRLLHHDGQYRWQVCRAVPELGPDGQAVRWYGTVVDNHEQKELRDELLRSEARFRFMAESIPQVVWTAQPDGRIDYLNQRWQELTGVPVEHSLRFGWTELVPPDDVAVVVGKYLTSMRSGTDYEQESRLLSAQDGQYRWFLHRAMPMRNAAGEVVKWFGTSTDIHDFKQAQQQLQAQNAQLRRINEDLDNFVYTASHDLKQPVNNMAGIFEELMRTARFDDPAAHELRGMFERAMHQMHDTVEDLSDVVQVQRRHEQLPAEPVELRAFTEEIIRSLQPAAAVAGATFTLDFDAAPTLQFVRPNLQSILYNLLSNALKYAHPDRPPVVLVRTELVDNEPVLLVQDNGLGIDLERHGRELFQMFRRFHDHVEGSGIGLYLVNRIVQQLGGTLSVASVVHEGTAFRLQLPGTLVARPQSAAPRSVKAEEPTL